MEGKGNRYWKRNKNIKDKLGNRNGNRGGKRVNWEWKVWGNNSDRKEGIRCGKGKDRG